MHRILIYINNLGIFVIIMRYIFPMCFKAFTGNLLDDSYDNAYNLISLLRESITRRQLAESLHVSTSTVERWESGKVDCKQAYIPALRDLYFGTTREDGVDFRTIDLFAGIGGIRRGFAANGGHAVFSSEWNEFSARTYRTNYGFAENMSGDITKIDAKDIPDCDVVLAGFPCQPFSVAGVSKKRSLGRETGFRDKTQGTLFFDVARIIAAKQPAAFLLENVKNLTSVSYTHLTLPTTPYV